MVCASCGVNTASTGFSLRHRGKKSSGLQQRVDTQVAHTLSKEFRSQGGSPFKRTQQAHPTHRDSAFAVKLERLPSHAGQLRKDIFPRGLVNGRAVFQTDRERRKNKNPRVTVYCTEL